MWAPLAALIFAAGAASTPGMIEAERQYLQPQEPVIEVEEIQTTAVEAVDTERLAAE